MLDYIKKPHLDQISCQFLKMLQNQQYVAMKSGL